MEKGDNLSKAERNLVPCRVPSLKTKMQKYTKKHKQVNEKGCQLVKSQMKLGAVPSAQLETKNAKLHKKHKKMQKKVNEKGRQLVKSRMKLGAMPSAQLEAKNAKLHKKT